MWVRVGDRLRLAATAEGSGADVLGERTEHPLPSDDALPLLEADLASPVTEGGELLGALTLTKTRGEPPTPADEALLRRLAGQLAPASRRENPASTSSGVARRP
jgi:GAF domain-containing protein